LPIAIEKVIGRAFERAFRKALEQVVQAKSEALFRKALSDSPPFSRELQHKLEQRFRHYLEDQSRRGRGLSP